jgi:predicted DNA-binding transcriptional regulator AlpA
MTNKISPTGPQLLSLKEVLDLIPVSKSCWYAGVASRRFPTPVKCGRRSFWPQSEIVEFIDSLKRAGESHELK